MPFFIPFLIIGALVGGAAVIAASTDEDETPEDWIAFVGPTSAGKSRLANDLLGRSEFAVGAEHGTTAEIGNIPYEDGWSIVDTPGILDGNDLAEIAAAAARRSRIIVICLDGEMYRQTFEWLEQVLLSIRHDKQVFVLPCLTKSDLREAMMPSHDRSKISARLNEQIQNLRSAIGGGNILIEDLQEGSIDRREGVMAKVRWGMSWVDG